MKTVKIRSRVNTLGVSPGEEVEIEETPEVRRKIQEGWFIELRPKRGARKSLPE